jgi:dienelactone hydrolase
MTTSEWLKPGIYGTLFGAAFVGIVGFSWGGWMTGGDAEEMANKMAQEE